MAAQLRALLDYAKNNGYSVAREYVDEAESGRIADRPRFRTIIDEGSKAAAPFKVILVWMFSRFTRKREHKVPYKSMLRRRGIEIGEDEAVLTYTIPMPQDGVTSESASVLDFVQSGPPNLTEAEPSIRLSL